MEAPLHQSHLPLPPPPHGAAAADVAGLQQQQPRQVAVVAGREQCPRCASRDTKFCYYNNYNTAQPRHFCRACRRYWTLGGSLRNVPIGGSTRKRPRPSRPTRAIVAAATATAGAVTTTTSSSSCGPFASSPVAAPAQSALLGSLLGSAPLLALDAAPLLDGRLGFDLGLGQPGAGELGPLFFGAAPLLWPTRILEGDNADTWKGAGVSPASVWQELAAAAPVEASGLHHGAPQLL